MDKIISSYETLFIVDAGLEEDAIAALVAKFKALIEENGELTTINEWGRRRLAYPINDKTEGYYTLITFKSGPEFPRELERIYGITDGILRSIVIRHEDSKKAAAETNIPTPAADVEPERRDDD
jgi:small subunit ribosomal protein S6